MNLESLHFQNKSEMPAIADIDEAREYVEDLLEQGIKPIVTVKKKWLDALSNGLEKHTSWIPGFDEVVGTLGIDPYIPNGEDRVFVEVDIDSSDQIQPRFTGPDSSFHGVVVLSGPIPPERIRVH